MNKRLAFTQGDTNLLFRITGIARCLGDKLVGNRGNSPEKKKFMCG
jgi:hypothetical protein